MTEALEELMKLAKEIRNIFLPNFVFLHPRVEVVTDTGWKLIATLSANVAVWYLHIEHTGRGDGVLIAFEENPDDRNVLGPFFGDNPLYPPAPGNITHPTTRMKRRTRPRHIYAKLDGRFYTPEPGEAGEGREEHGPLVSIEEWYFYDKEGQTDEHLSLEVKTSQTSFISQVENEQKRILGESNGQGG